MIGAEVPLLDQGSVQFILLGVTIIVGQLPKLFGFSTDADTFVDEVRSFFDGLDQRNRYTLAVGLASLALLLILPRFTRRLPAVLIVVLLFIGGAVALTVSTDGFRFAASPCGMPKGR
jgi:MFS superfamily sulfate permease-like transporter